jgi:iron complex transport system substrate-binding protein
LRIVSLLPSATELLFAIGAGDEVVAVTHECDHPAAVRSLPAVTSSAIDHRGQSCAAIDRHIRRAVHEGSSIYRIDEPLLARLSPDLIVTQELCEVCAVTYAELQRCARRLPGDVPVLSLEPNTVEDILATALVLGEATGHQSGAGALQARMRAGLAAVRARPAPEPRPGVVCVEWTDPLMAAGHWVPEMVEAAGGRDLLGNRGARSEYVDWEQVVAAAPEVMVLMPCGFGLERSLETAAELTSRPGFDRLPCARGGRVAAVDGSAYFNRPGPRVVDGLELLAAIVRGRPGDALPPGAAWVPL